MTNKKLYVLCFDCSDEIAGLTENLEVARAWEDGRNSKLNKLYGAETDGVIRLYYTIEPDIKIGALDDEILH